MARISANRTWYEQVEPSTFSEEQFEFSVVFHAPSVYHLYHVVPFKRPVKVPSDTSTRGYIEVIPDLIFIAKDYKDWWICEVEMGYHSYNSHVKPQIQGLLQAEYGPDEAEYICRKYSALDYDRVIELFRTSPSRVIVIVNQHMPKWTTGWPEGRVVFAVFEMFRSQDGLELFRVNGEYPCYIQERVSACSPHPIIPRLLEICEPERLQLPRRGIIQLIYNNCVTEWQRTDDDDGKVYITSLSRNPLKPNKLYSIFTRSDRLLALLQEYIATDVTEEGGG